MPLNEHHSLCFLCRDVCSDPSSTASQGPSQKAADWGLVLTWLLPRKDEDDDADASDLVLKVSPHLLGEACVRLICKNRALLEKFGYPSELKVQDDDAVQKIHSAYGSIPPIPAKQPLPAYQPKPQIFKTGLDVLSALLADDSNRSRNQNCSLNSQISSKDMLNSLGALIHKVIVNATVLSHLLEMKLLEADTWKEFSIAVETVHLLHTEIPAGFTQILTDTKENFYSMGQILLLHSLYSANFHVEVLKLIRKSTPQEFLDQLFKCCSQRTSQIAKNINSISYISYVEPEKHCPFLIAGFLTREEEKMILFTKINSAFCFHPFLPLKGRTQQHSKEVLKMCYELALSPSSFTLVGKQKILLVLKMASLATKYFDIDHSNFIMESLKKLTINHQSDLLMAVPILNILEGMLGFLHTLEHTTHKSFAQSITRGFKVLIERKKRFGIHARLALISCIGKWIQLDPEQTWSKLNEVPAALELLDFVKDPYKEARLAVAEFLSHIFKPCAPGWSFEQTIKWRETVWQKVTQVVSESVSALDENKKDDAYNVGTSALKCLAETMVYCPEQRKKTLFAIFEVLKKLKVKRTIIDANFEKIGMLFCFI